jgi:hypothetical protein
VFPMSLPDLANAHQRDIDRQLERAALAQRGEPVASTDAVSSLLAAFRRLALRRPVATVCGAFELARKPLPLLASGRRVTASPAAFAAEGDEGCPQCGAVAG